MIEIKTLAQIKTIIANGETCVINLTANWCSDCTDQAENLNVFSEVLAKQKTPCYTIAVQDEKNIYLSAEHQVFTELFGGHGFPRTVLMVNGKNVDADNVEIISSIQLNELAQKFIAQL
ncbi:hypothetical protein GCM10007916_15780 [Psychromonas marina]|uniref:Thioredoxin n=1 Tax=Psychromonas marina TaxID=88364 RepID=A0ABQ6E0H5_9GAMM|nr:periplasmic thioredoxin of cytochrome c-type biogenesis [Psychromonas marina]GLS90511.1 hypothetical protein GCM10007916_15780 [Psychromonas marina]